MNFSEELKATRQRCFLSQEAFAREIKVSFSSVNRWESGRARPNLIAMKNIQAFCESHSINFDKLEQAWFEIGKKEQVNG